MFKGTMPITKNLPNEWYNTPNLHMCTIQDFVNFCNKKSIKIDKSMCLTNEKISEITKVNMQYKNIFFTTWYISYTIRKICKLLLYHV